MLLWCCFFLISEFRWKTNSHVTLYVQQASKGAHTYDLSRGSCTCWSAWTWAIKLILPQLRRAAPRSRSNVVLLSTRWIRNVNGNFSALINNFFFLLQLVCVGWGEDKRARELDTFSWDIHELKLLYHYHLSSQRARPPRARNVEVRGKHWIKWKIYGPDFHFSESGKAAATRSLDHCEVFFCEKKKNKRKKKNTKKLLVVLTHTPHRERLIVSRTLQLSRRRRRSFFHREIISVSWLKTFKSTRIYTLSRAKWEKKQRMKWWKKYERKWGNENYYFFYHSSTVSTLSSWYGASTLNVSKIEKQRATTTQPLKVRVSPTNSTRALINRLAGTYYCVRRMMTNVDELKKLFFPLPPEHIIFVEL